MVLLGSNCGIEDFPAFLESPAKGFTAAPVFEFLATAENSETEFLGFELYYKFYLGPSDPQIQDDRETIGVFDDLVVRGFRRLNRARNSTLVEKPLIPVVADKGKRFAVQISFEDLTNPDQYPEITVTPIDVLTSPDTMTAQGLRRSVTYKSGAETGDYKRFNDFYEETPGTPDADITAAMWDEIQNSQPIVIALYVLSYGVEVSTTANLILYSRPLSLDYISWTFPASQ